MRFGVIALTFGAFVMSAPTNAQETQASTQEDYVAALTCASKSMLLSNLFAENKDPARAEVSDWHKEQFKSVYMTVFVKAVEIGKSLGKSQAQVGTEFGNLLFDKTEEFKAARQKRTPGYIQGMFAEVDACRERFGA